MREATEKERSDREYVGVCVKMCFQSCYSILLNCERARDQEKSKHFVQHIQFFIGISIFFEENERKKKKMEKNSKENI